MLRRLRVAGLLAAVVLLGGCDWPMFGFDAAHTGSSPDPGISKDAVVGSMVLEWTASTGAGGVAPTVAKGVAYAVGGSALTTLEAFDAAGNTNCGGTPKTCSPLWTAVTGGQIAGSPAVAGGIVYVGAGDTSDPAGKLYAFDAAGNTKCAGTPKVCSPLWTANTSLAIGESPTVANGVVYVGADKLYAFDAAGNTNNCGGTPTTCRPLWTGTTNPCCFVGSPAVANGVVYAGADKLYAFNAAGNTNCMGTPKVCSPLWTASGGGSSPTVAKGVAFSGADAFDAAGNTNCAGTPKVCSPLWTIATATGPGFGSLPAVANGVEYLSSGDDNLYAFDATGNTNCAGTPKVCHPLWSATDGFRDAPAVAPAAVANGIVYVGANDQTLYAFDAAGNTNCTGTPKVCSPLWSVFDSGFSTPVVANWGHIYINAFGGTSGELQVYGLEG